MLILAYPGVGCTTFVEKDSENRKEILPVEGMDFEDERGIQCLVEQAEKDLKVFKHVCIPFNFAIWQMVLSKRVDHVIVYPHEYRFQAWLDEKKDLSEEEYFRLKRKYGLDKERLKEVSGIYYLKMVIELDHNAYLSQFFA